jgi:hypothetical protein
MPGELAMAPLAGAVQLMHLVDLCIGQDRLGVVLTHALVALVHGDLLLDDAPLLDWLPRATWRPVIFATPWNGTGSKWEHLPRWSWSEPLLDLLCAGVSGEG